MSEKPLENDVKDELKEELNEDKVETVPENDETHSEPQSNSEGSEEAKSTDGADNPDATLDTESYNEKIANLEAELQEVTNRSLRIQADFDNFRRRTREEKSQERKWRAQDLVSDLLPVLDNFKRALDVEAATEEGKSLKQGMEMVYRQLQEAMKKEGLEEVEALNQAFDPNIHQAVMQEEVEGVEPNTVVNVFQAGFSLNGKVIRPAMVKVSS